jgi:hypothetical protein
MIMLLWLFTRFGQDGKGCKRREFGVGKGLAYVRRNMDSSGFRIEHR